MKWHEASATSRVFSSTCPITSTGRIAPKPRVLSRRTCTPLAASAIHGYTLDG